MDDNPQTNKKNRLIHLNPLAINLPFPALLSISHRVSGLAVFLLIPLLLWVLHLSLDSAQSFNALTNFLTNPILSSGLFILSAALVFHLLTGIRHLLMDLHIGLSLRGAFISAILVAVVFIACLMLFIGGFI